MMRDEMVFCWCCRARSWSRTTWRSFFCSGPTSPAGGAPRLGWLAAEAPYPGPTVSSTPASSSLSASPSSFLPFFDLLPLFGLLINHKRFGWPRLKYGLLYSLGFLFFLSLAFIELSERPTRLWKPYM